MSAYAVARLVLIAAAILAWVLVRVAPQHRPAARALSALAVIDVALALGDGRVDKLLQAELFLAAYAVQIALALRAFARVPPSILTAPGVAASLVTKALQRMVSFAPWTALILWIVAVYALALRWDLALKVYKVAFFVALAVQVIAVALFVSRRPRSLPGPAQGVSGALALSAVADVAGPWLKGTPVQSWAEGGKTALFTWIAVVAWEVWRWRVCTRR